MAEGEQEAALATMAKLIELASGGGTLTSVLPIYNYHKYGQIDFRSAAGPQSFMLRGRQLRFGPTLAPRPRPYSSTERRIGFIGIGQMGAPMAKSLLKAGYDVTVCDTDPERVAGFPKHTTKLEELASTHSRIITMLPSNAAVESAYLRTRLAELAPVGSTFIDCSTVAPAVARDVHRALIAKGHRFMDAPVSGGTKGAQAGTLTFLVGGPRELVSANESLLLAMGRRVLPCGEVGHGQAAKICNNTILAVSMVALAESLNLGQRLGLDPVVLSEVINASSGRSWASELYNPIPGVQAGVPASQAYAGGFACRLLLKDLGLALAEARQAKAVLPTAEASERLYQAMLQEQPRAMADKDFSIVYQYLSRLHPQ